MPPVELDKPLNGGCVGQVIKSRNTKFQVGEYVRTNSGWREYWISQDADNDKNIITKIDPKIAPIQNSLGILGSQIGLVHIHDQFRAVFVW